MFDNNKVVDKEAFFIYVNAKGKVERYHIVNAHVTDHHIQGVSVSQRKFKTFRIDQIIEMFSSLSELDSSILPEIEQPLHKHVKTIKNNSLEIHFTGFSAKDKIRLEELANNSGMVVRHGVSTMLSFICCGKNAGPTKIKRAIEQGALAISEDQFTTLLETGEIPETSSYDIFEREVKDFDKIQKTFSTLRTLPRRQALIARFVDGYAAGWAFAVHECHRPSLDIKLTPVMHNEIVNSDADDCVSKIKHTEMAWTQGHDFNFIGGELIYSHKEGRIGKWADFLKIKEAVVLSVKYSTPAGFDTVDTLEGRFTGDFRCNNAATDAGNRHQENIPIFISSQTYDEGSVTIAVSRPNGERLVEVERVELTQVEFVTLLQMGEVVRINKSLSGKGRVERYSPFDSKLHGE
ncbi:hypothetical protein [Aeromonas jandaei]|uniref:hypothetical protein n=1 Tax=Aeromonas jandaei TaxID=650 RepID=UPI001ADD6376|nr:hypothetical protein [Aeromonas jandaei]QTL95563.1 DNA ligase [Aeromonas jandaei]